jgi:hypothetical protein
LNGMMLPQFRRSATVLVVDFHRMYARQFGPRKRELVRHLCQLCVAIDRSNSACTGERQPDKEKQSPS